VLKKTLNEMKKLLLFLLVLTGNTYLSYSQDTIGLKPSGKPEVLIFTDLNSSFSGGKNLNRFEITRAYFGYSYNFSPNWSGRLVFDVGNPGAGKFQLTALLKYGYLQFQKSNLTAKLGMINTTQYDVQEKFWGYRYVLKSFQDQYNMGPSADLGFSAAYNFGSIVSADFIIQNGEGYKTLDVDSVLKTGLGLTITPIKNLLLRAYYDRMKKGQAIQQTTALMAGYSNSHFKLGGEYNFQTDNVLVNGNDFSGYSVYGSLYFNPSFDLFARTDCLTSEKNLQSNPWNYSRDGRLYQGGIEYLPIKGLKIAPNFQLWQPRNSAEANIYSIFLNAEIRF
jgi:hypothetical protein